MTRRTHTPLQQMEAEGEARCRLLCRHEYRIQSHLGVNAPIAWVTKPSVSEKGKPILKKEPCILNVLPFVNQCCSN